MARDSLEPFPDMTLRPWVIRQGDFLLQLANTFGFDADSVWQDPANAELRAIRPDPNILAPGDILYIPDVPTNSPSTPLTTGSTNDFVAPDPPTITLTHKFVGFDPATYASKAYTVQELDQLTGLQSDENGVVTFQAPVTLQTATIVFTDSGESWALCIGAMDPINTMSGIFQRLQNLGYIGADVSYDYDVSANNLGVIRAGLFALKAAQARGGDDAAPDSAPADSGPASDVTPDSGPTSDVTPDSGPASDPAPRGSGWRCHASYASDPGPSSGAASGPSSPDDGDPEGDNGGLADDGTLDADTEALLRGAYGC